MPEDHEENVHTFVDTGLVETFQFLDGSTFFAAVVGLFQ